LQIGDGGTSGSIIGSVTDNGIFAFDLSDSYTFGGVISGDGEFLQRGAGTTILTAANTYTGGTTINAGTLDLAAFGAAGTNAITFGKGTEVLKIENAALSAGMFGYAIDGFGVGDKIDLPGLAFVAGATASYNTGTGLLTVISNGVTDTLKLSDSTFVHFAAINDRSGGTEIIVAPPLSAKPDHEHLKVQGTLSVSASNGVLAHETDPIPNDHLFVSAVDGQASNVGHPVTGQFGTMMLNADGSYSYAANGVNPLPQDGVGEDIFTYTAEDGAGDAATATLTFFVLRKGTTYLGGAADTTVYGHFGKSVLDGSPGNDTLVAGSGKEVLIGGPGDTLEAGSGLDTFVFLPGFGHNAIKSFNPLLNKIQLTASEFANLAAVQHDMQQVGANTVITYDAHDTITLIGLHAASLHASNFEFV
jgi:autotransporter-associated beta strand protein/VCBS repeat-containing protein